MLCTFCLPTILGGFYRIPEKLPKSTADKMYRACETKDQTLKKTRTLHFQDLLVSGKMQAQKKARKILGTFDGTNNGLQAGVPGIACRLL